jgi:hypothetical protein
LPRSYSRKALLVMRAIGNSEASSDGTTAIIRCTTTFAASAFGLAPKKNIFTCASESANKVSIAGGLQSLGIGNSGVSGFVTNALGGNTFSGITDLVSSIATGSAGGHSVFYNMGTGDPNNAVPANPCAYMGNAMPPSAYAAEGKAAKWNALLAIQDLQSFPRGGALEMRSQ